MPTKGILDDYLNKEVTLILDIGFGLDNAQKPIKARGNLVESNEAYKDSYALLIIGWTAVLGFTVSEAKAELILGDNGVLENITLTVIPTEVF